MDSAARHLYYNDSAKVRQLSESSNHLFGILVSLFLLICLFASLLDLYSRFQHTRFFQQLADYSKFEEKRVHRNLLGMESIDYE